MFDKVIFAGGGSRCWWQAGFWDAVHARIELRPRLIAGVGAGAAMACLLHANDSSRALAWYERALDGADGQWHWGNLVRQGQRVLPHEALHRKALRALLGGDRFRDLMWTAPEIRVQFARLPAGGHPAWLTARGIAKLAFDKSTDPRLPIPGARRQGMRPEQRRIQDCQSERELVDLLVAAGSLPPFTSPGSIGGAPVLDGGLLGVPLEAVADVPGSTLVLLTRHYRDLAPVFARDGRVYVQPSRPVGVAAWNHGSSRKFRAAYDLGAADARAFLSVFALDRAPELERTCVAAAEGVEVVGLGEAAGVIEAVDAIDAVETLTPLAPLTPLALPEPVGSAVSVESGGGVETLPPVTAETVPPCPVVPPCPARTPEPLMVRSGRCTAGGHRQDPADPPAFAAGAAALPLAAS